MLIFNCLFWIENISGLQLMTHNWVFFLAYGSFWGAKDSWAASVITAFKDIFKNHPRCWIHLALQPCSVLFPLVFLMLLSMALEKRATWKPLCHQQDSKTSLCWLARVPTPAACQKLKGGIFSSEEFKPRSQPMVFLHFWLFDLDFCLENPTHPGS